MHGDRNALARLLDMGINADGEFCFMVEEKDGDRDHVVKVYLERSECRNVPKLGVMQESVSLSVRGALLEMYKNGRGVEVSHPPGTVIICVISGHEMNTRKQGAQMSHATGSHAISRKACRW